MFDLVVIGAGPGGYVAAIRGAQLGLKVALVEQRDQPGGTCLNEGCIPSKALLESSHLLEQIQGKAKTLGVLIDAVSPDWGQMQVRKNQIIKQNQKGLFFLFKKNQIQWLQGTAKVLSPTSVGLTGDHPQVLETKNILIATGSSPRELSFAPFDGQTILSSTDLLALPKLPKSLTVIGGGVIGLELGSLLKGLGTEVTVVEQTNSLLPGMDKDLAKELLRCLKKQKIKFKFNHRLQKVEILAKGGRLKLEDGKGGVQTLESEQVLVSVGRVPHTTGLGLEKLGVELDSQGFVKVGRQFETTLPGVYAIGDVIGGLMLAHKASEEGVWAVETLVGKTPKRSWIPSAVYTYPELASVGATEPELTQQGVDFKTGRFNFRPLGRALAAAEPDGFIKVISDATNGRLLGVHMIGQRATDLIATACLALDQQMTAAQLGELCFAHPSYAEALKEAAQDVNLFAIHQ